IPGSTREFIIETPGFVAKLFGADQEKVEKATELTKKILPGSGLPTSEKLKEKTSKLTGEYLKPKTPGEAFSDEATEFIAPLLIPGSQSKNIGALNKAKKIAMTVFKGIGGKAFGNYVRGQTGSEGLGKAAQIGSFIAMTLFNPLAMKKYVDELYSSARKSIPENARVSTRNYGDKLDTLKREINSSLSPSDSQKKILGKITEIENKMGTRENPNVILDTKQSINEDLSELMQKADKTTRKQIRAYMKRLSGITNETLKEYGESNPDFWAKQRAEDEAFGTLAESTWVAKGIEKSLGGKKYQHLEKALPFLIHGIGKLTPAIGGIAGKAATPAYFLARFAYRYAKSPVLRKHYNQLLLGGMEGNQKLTESAATALEKELAK